MEATRAMPVKIATETMLSTIPKPSELLKVEFRMPLSLTSLRIPIDAFRIILNPLVSLYCLSTVVSKHDPKLWYSLDNSCPEVRSKRKTFFRNQKDLYPFDTKESHRDILPRKRKKPCLASDPVHPNQAINVSECSWPMTAPIITVGSD